MKKKLFFILFVGVFFAYCSNDSVSDIVPEDNMETRATEDNPFILTTPLDLHFNDTVSLEIKEVNVKVAGLPSLGAITSFSYRIQGEDANQFSVVDFDVSLEEFIEALLGQGLDIPVSFHPTEPGDYEAELLITASLLGILLPMQETVSLYGSYNPEPIRLVSSSPVEGGTSVFIGDDPDTENENGYVEQGYYYLTFRFNQDIILTPNFYIGGTATLVDYSVSGSVITMYIRDFYASNGLLTPVRFPPGSIKSKKTGVGNSIISFPYIVGKKPDSYQQ